MYALRFKQVLEFCHVPEVDFRLAVLDEAAVADGGQDWLTAGRLAGPHDVIVAHASHKTRVTVRRLTSCV